MIIVLFKEHFHLIVNGNDLRINLLIKNSPITCEKTEDSFSISWSYIFKGSNDTVYFAFCYPYPFETVMKILDSYDYKEFNSDFMKSDIYYHRELLINSVEGRRIDLLTVYN